MNDLIKKYIPTEMYSFLKEEFSDRNSKQFRIELEEFLKFMVLYSYYPNSKKSFIPVSKDIDLIWHAYILQNKRVSTTMHISSWR